MNFWKACKRTVFLLGVIFVISTLTGRFTAQAQGGLQVTQDQAQLEFPRQVTFLLQAKSSSKIEQVTLLYGSNARTCINSVGRKKIDDLIPGQQVSLEWTWDFAKSRSLPPGAQIWWQWELRDEAGNILLTEKRTMTVEDDRFTWNTVQDGGVSVTWVEGDQAFGKEMLQIALDSLARLSRDAGIQPLDQVRLTVYPSAEAMRGAALFLPEWSGGVAFPEYSVIITGIYPGEDEWARSVIPHEMAHLVTGQVVFNCLGVDLPTWLSEGLAVYNEGGSAPEEIEKLLRSLQEGTLPPLNTLATGFSVDASEALRAYAYSGEIVRFMIENYGAKKMAGLLETMRAGKTIDPALRQVYGVDTAGLDQTWRAANGVGEPPEVDMQPTAAPTRTAVPTLALWTAAFEGPTSSETPVPSDTQLPTPVLTHTPVEVARLPSDTPPPAAATPSLPPKPGSSPLRCLGSMFIPLAMSGVLIWRARSSARRFGSGRR